MAANTGSQTGGRAVLGVLLQMAEYDPMEHESKLADIIADEAKGVTPTTEHVAFALVQLLRSQSIGQDDCLTMQALGELHSNGAGYNDHDWERDVALTTLEQKVVADAEQFAGQLAHALEGILLRTVHGNSERLG